MISNMLPLVDECQKRRKVELLKELFSRVSFKGNSCCETVERCSCSKSNGSSVTSSVPDFSQICVGQLLGKGGFGSVCKCEWQGRTYALKKFHTSLKNDRAKLESYEAEKMALTLRHRNIVRTYAVFDTSDTHYILMEYVSRGTLQSILDNPSEVIDRTRMYRFVIDIACGLKDAHEQNIAHLDLKPANILVTSTGVCKIGDFGCCAVVGQTEAPSTPTKSNLTGTYSYRAPELLRGESATVKADIYSMGICMWQILTREKPYGHEHHQVIIFKVVAYNCRPKIPECSIADSAYTDLMEKCWSRDKLERPDAQEIISILS